MACRPPAGNALRRFKAINSRRGGGAAWSLPLLIEEMDAKTRNLALLASLSLFCAIFAWAGDRDVVGSAFFALGLVAIVGAAYGQQR
jgi:hypothetical protein